jgi:prepilin-type N-terminal cleavage/methylation domain-containing protein
MSQSKNGEAGFTILEMMIAVVVLSIGLMSAAAMQTRAIQESNFANRLTERVTSTERAMEDLMLRKIVPTDADVDSLFVGPTGSIQDAPTDEGGKAFYTECRIIPNSPLPNLTTIQVISTPTGMSAEDRQRRQIVFSYVRSTRWN